MMMVLTLFWQIGQPLRAATFYWDSDADATGNNAVTGASLGGTGSWNTTNANWWDGISISDQAWNNANNDTAIFWGANGGTVTLDAGGITAGALQFKTTGYTLTGGTLALAGTGDITANLGTYSIIASLLNGTNGLTLAGANNSGRGAVRLTNSANSYTGVTTINSGTLVIDNNGELGADTSTVAINGVQTPGLAGGSLMLLGNTSAGSYSSGFTLSRNLSMTGGGGGNVVQTSALSGSALISVGNNTISGLLTTVPNALGIQTGAASSFGVLTLSNLSIGGTAVTNYTTLGSTSSIGSFNINGILAGTGSIQKTGFGTLILSPTDATGFSGTLRVGAGSIRVSSVAALGSNVGTGANSVIDLNGGVFEFRADTFNASTKGVDFRANSTLFVDHAVGTLGAASINGAATFGNLLPTNNVTLTFNSRNGFSTTFNAMTVTPANASGDVTLTNNGSGLVTLTGNVWGQTTNSNTLTVNGTGDFRFNTGITASGGAADSVAKSGAGTLTIAGTASTYTGTTTVSAGILTITDFRSLTLASAGDIVLGATTVAGTLNFGTSTASTAAGLTSAVNGTTLLTSAFSAGATTITLASTSGLVVGSPLSGTGLAPGTTVASIAGKVVTLSTPATGAGTANQVITSAAVTTTRVIDLAGTTGGATINANQTVAAPVILAATTPTTTVVSASGAGSKTLTLGGTSTQINTINGAIVDNLTGTNLTSVTKADAGTWQLAGVNTYTGTTTITAGLLKIKANAAASTIVADASAITFNSNATTLTAGGTLEFTGISGSATTETLGALTATAGAGTIILTSGGGGSAANLTFTSLGATTAASSVNFVTTGGGGGLITLTGQATTTATTLPGTANFLGHLYVNGADFAAINASAQVFAPTYGSTAGFVNGGAALTAGSHNLVNAAISSQVAVAVTSLKMTTFNLTMAGNLTLNTGALLQTGGSATIDGTASGKTILGGATATNIAIRVNGASDTLTLTSNVTISSTQTGGLTKNGAGTLIIQGTNAQTGATTINEGTIQLSGASARLSGANAATVLRQGATLDLNGQSTGTSIGSFDGAGTVTNSNAAAATLILGNATTGAGIFSGIIQDGAGVTNVTLTGTTGTPTWSGLNTYTGVTTIGTTLATTKLVNVTTLANYGSASSIGKGIQSVVSDANNAASLVFGGSGGTEGIAYTGTTSVIIDRLFTLNGTGASGGGQIANNSANNSTLIMNGVANAANNVIFFGASATAAQTLTLGGSSTGDNQFNIRILDNGALKTNLTKVGAGLWILGNTANSYTGITLIAGTGATAGTAGYLQAIDGSTLPTASGLVLGGTTTGGVLVSSGNFTRDLVASASAGSNTVSWATGLTTGASGFSASDSKLVVALGGLASPTALTWNSGGFMGTAATTTAPLQLSSIYSLAEVEFRNAINLNGANRTIQVDDNTSTFTDFATISGVISNSGAAAGIIKTGTGTLQLLAANTYTGTTAVQSGILVVNSLGLSTGPATGTSVGMSNGGAVSLGSGSTTTGTLVYVGSGETSDRGITFLGTTTAAPIIVADGSGALVLSGVFTNTAGTTKTLTLRGSNNFANEITSVLANNGANALSVTHDSAGTWILSGVNTYTGATTVNSGGSLGVGNDQALGVGGALALNNATIFASGGDRNIANPITLTNTTNAIDAYVGDYSLTFNGAVTNGTTSVISRFTRNNIVTGKTLTFNGAYTFTGAVTGTSWNFDGSGDTILNGLISQASAGAASTSVVGITYSGTGSLTLGNTGNVYLGATTISSGTLKVGASEVIPDGVVTASSTTTAGSSASTTVTAPTAGLYAGMSVSGIGIAANSVIASITDANSFKTNVAQTIGSGTVLSFSIGAGAVILNPAAGATATLDLNGENETINGLTANSAGNAVINNSSLSAASLTFGANNQTATIAPSAGGTFTISNTGGGALSLTKTGTASVTIPSSGVTLSYTGATSVTGGTLTIAAALNGTTALSAIGTGSNLNLTGGLTAPGSITSVTVGGGAFLSLLDGAGSALSNLTSLNLGAGSGIATLSLELGALSDTLTVNSAAVVANTIRLNLSGISGLQDATSYTVLAAPSGLSAGTYVLGSQPGGFSSGFLTVTDSLVQYTTGNAIVGNLVWNNTQGTGSWATNNSGATNFTTDLGGTTDGTFTPGPGTTVIFGTTVLTGGPAFTTTLDANFTVAGLQFTANPSGVTSWTINAGTPATSNLTIKSGGIDVASNAGAVTINANVILGAAQSWNVNGTGANGSSLTVASVISGSGFALSKTGAGTLNLSGINTFNGGLTLKAGTVIGTVSASVFGAGTITLGDTTGSNSATLQVNTTGLTYANAIALAAGGTGTLSIGTPVNAAAVNATFSGGVTGTNSLTINNQSLSGTTTFSVNALNNAGTITNLSSSTGTVTISGGIGSNVTQIIENSTTSALTISTTALNVNSAGTILQNLLGTKLLTVSATVQGTGDLILKNDSVTAGGVTVSGPVNNVGAVINNGVGLNATSGTIISGIIGASVTGVVQDSLNSSLQLTGANTFTSGITIKKGILEGATSASSLGAAGNVITLGDTAGSSNASLRLQSNVTYNNTPLNVVAGSSGTLSILGSRTTGASIFPGAITLAHDLTIAAGDVGATTANLTFTGGVTGTGNLDVNYSATALTGGVTFSTNALNMVGTITNRGNTTGALTISAAVGANVTSITQNSATSAMTLSGANSFTGPVNLTLGTLNVNNANALGATGSGGLFTIAGGTVLNNSVAATPITNLANNAVKIEGDFTFTGTSSLNLGTGAVNLGTSAGTTRTITTTASTLTFGGVISNGTTANSLSKAGAGTLSLLGANTFTGGVTVTAGTLEFATVSSNGGGASSLGQGTDGISLAGTLSFVGGTSQTTNRAITLTGTGTLSANGTGGATITYQGAVTAAGNGLVLDGTGTGFLNGVLTQTGTVADLTKNGTGTWTLGATNTIVDDLIINAGVLIVNAATGFSGDDVFIRGGVLKLGVNGALTSSMDDLNISVDTASGSVLDIAGTTGSGPTDIFLGNVGFTGSLIDSVGGGSIGGTFGFRDGTVSASMTGTGTMTKTTAGTVTLSGANTGYTGAAVVSEGTLVLDYTSNNGEKLSNTSAGALTGSGGAVIFNGNASAATSEQLGGLTVTAGATHITLNNGSGQTATLNISGAFTRTVTGGTVDFVTSSGNAVIQTTAANASGLGILGGYATVSGSRFATVSGGVLQGLSSTVKNDLSTWVLADNVTDSTGYTGSVGDMSISSLRFDAAGATSTVTVNAGSRLNIASGGILITSNVGAGNASITGGTLMSGNGLDLIVLQNNTTSDFTIASNISTLGLTKSGTGTLVLSGFNTYSGQTTLNEGTTKLAGGNAIGDTSAVSIKNATTAVLDLNGSNETIGSLSGGGVDGGTVAIGTSRLTVNETANSTFSGFITGSGALIKTGAATLTINTNANSFTGALIVNQGQITLADRTDANFSSLSTLTLNNGVLLLDFTGGTESSPNKINNSATVTLINTGGTDGLRANNDRNDASKAETVGAMTLLGGANTITLQENASVGTSTRAMTITTASLARSNRATLLVRGNNLGDTGAGGVTNTGRFVATTAPSGFDFVGGGGAFGSTTISIVPWMIGDSTATGSTAHGNGSSFVTYAATTGFRPLTTSEYEQLVAAGGVTAANNVRYSAGADLTLSDATARTMNALLVENTSGSTGITLAGAGASLNVASGAFLFLGTQAVNVSGFSGITTTGGLNEYILHVVNTAPGTGVTIGSAFTTSGAALTKSGAGTLTLTSTGSTYTGPTTINQGVLQIDSLANLGNNGSGGIVINGGTLRFGTAFDASAVGLTFGVAATTNVVTTTGATFETNFDVTLANAIGGGGNGGFTKTGTGKLTLQSSATYTGNTTVADGRLILNGGANNRLPNSGLTLGSGSTSGVLQLGDGVNGASNLTVASLSTSGSGTSNAIVGGAAGASVLTVNQTTTTTYAGGIGGAGTNENNIGIVKSGLGILTLSGATLTYTGVTSVDAGTLNITGSTGAALTTSGISVAAGGTLNLLNGVGQAINLGAGTLSLGAGSGAAVLGLELGSTSAYDSINLTGAATTANTVVLNLTGLAGFGTGTYDLLTASGGLNGANFVLGSLSGALSGLTWSLAPSSSTVVRLGVTASTGNFYWSGGVSNSWMGNSGLSTNFTTDAAGTINASGTPGAASTVIFSAQNVTGPVISTTLDASFTVNDLKFTSNPSGVTAVTIAAGTPSTNSLTIAPSVSTVGIDVASNAGAITISAPLVLGAAQTWNVNGTGANGSSLAVSGGITGAGALTLNTTGTGTITLSGTNTYTGVTTVSGGLLQAGSANAFSASSAYVISGSGTLRLNNLAQIIGSLAGSGTVENGPAGTAARVLTAGGDNTSTLFSGVLQDGGPFALSLTKTGTGALTLSGANTYTGATAVSNGILNITGSWTGNAASSLLAYGGSATNTVVNVSGDMTLLGTTGGNVSGAVAVYNQTAGTVTATGNTTSAVYVAGAAGSYGYFNLTGGTYKDSLRFALAVTTSLATQATAVLYIGGTGFLDLRNSEWMLNYSHGQLTVADSGLVDRSGATQPFGLIMNSTTAGGVYGVLNVAGGSFLTTTQPIKFGNSTTAGNGNNNSAFINLAAGTLQVGTAMTSSLPTGGGNNAYLNFAGGTLKTSAGITNWIPTSSTTLTFTSTVFGAINNSAVAGAPSFAGGLTFDTNGFNSSFNTPFNAAAGVGVTQADMTVSGGSGYIGAPEVVFSSAGVIAGGTPASGYALISGGAVVGIVITSPGTYTSGTTPTATLTGGGGTGASVTIGALSTANTSGGVTKIGAGTLTLSGANTYTGGTFVNEGSLALGANNVLADAGNVTVNGGTFDISTFTDTVAKVTLQSGTITGTTGVLTATSAYELQSGTVAAILAGSVGVNKSTSGTVTLSAVNTYTGAVNVTGGTLAFSASSNLGNASSSSNTVTVDGGTLSYTGASSVDLGANRVLTVGAGDATLNVSNSLGVLTFSAGVNAASSGDLTKTGAGAAVLSGTVNLNGGAVSVNNGTLRAGFGTSGISALTIGATGVMDFSNGSAQALAGLTGLTLNGGARIGFELGSLSSDSLAAINAATASGTITLDFAALSGGISAMTYNLISATSGLAGASYILGTGISGWNLVINTTDTLVSLTATPFVPVYWRGGQNFSWNTLGAATANWTTDSAGLLDATQTPQSNNTVIFSAAGAPFSSGTQITTTLDAAFTIDSLIFDAAPSGVTAVTINPGTGGSLALVPVSSSAGIEVRDNAGTVTIAAPLTVGAAGGAPSQTWSVSNVGASLVISGSTVITDTINKTGAGALTLSGSNTGAGGVTLSAGTLNINSSSALGTGAFIIGAGSTINNSSAGAITLAASNVQTWNGSFIFTGTQSLNLGTGAVSMLNHTTITVNGQTLTVGGVITEGAANRTLTKAGSGTLVLGGNNVIGGGFSLLGGALSLNNAGAIGTGVFTIEAGTTIDNITGGLLALAANNVQVWNGSYTFTGSSSLNLGSGNVTLGNNVTVNTVASTLSVGGVIDDGANTFGLTKYGAGSLSLGGSNTYDGATVLNQGALIFTASQNLTASTNTLTLGETAGSTSALSMDLSAASATFGGAALVQTNNTIANTITIGAGQTLRLNGSFTLGYNSAANSTTALTITGSGGTFSIGGVGAPTNANVQIGNGATTTISNAGILDMSGLGTFYANLGTGTFRVGSPTNAGGQAVAGSIVILAANSTIIATTITSDSPDTSGVTQAIKLGSGTNVLNATTITIGGAANRAKGTLDFNGATGTVQIRNLAGTGRAAMNVQNGNSGTTGSLFGTVDFTGHNADLLLGALAIGGRSAGTTGSGTGAFSFDTGTLDATTINLAARTGTSMTSGSVTGTLTLGGGTVTVGTLTMSTNSVSINSNASNGDASSTLTISGSGTNTITTMTMGTLSVTNTTALSSGSSDATATVNVSGGATTIGTLTMGANNSAATTVTANTATSALNISGGAVTVTNNLTMAQTTLRAANAATATISITGGSLTVGGSILYTDGLGTESNTVTLNGGLLDMTAGSIGASSALVTFNAQSGTLRNLSELNGGGALTKTTTGTLILDTANSYTGATAVSAGVLAISNGGALGGTTNGTSVAAGGTLSMSGDITVTGESLSLAAGAGGSATLNNQSGNNTWTGNLTVDTGSDASNRAVLNSDAGKLTVSGNVGLTGSQDFVLRGDGNGEISGQITGSQRLFKSSVGTGTWILSGNNSSTFTGKTSVGNGALQISSESNLGATPGSFAANQLTLGGGSTNGRLITTGTMALSANRGVTVAAGGGTFETASATTLTVNSVITGNGALTKEGGGTLIFTAVNTNTGTTTVNAGVLGGTGSVGGDLAVASGGTLAPGVGAGQFTVTGNLTVSSGGTLLMQLGGATTNDAAAVRSYFDSHSGSLAGMTVQASYENYIAGTTLHDNILVNGAGAPVINGTVKIDSAFLNGYTLAYGDIFKLIDWSAAGSIGGTTSFDYTGVVFNGDLSFNTDLFASNGILVVVPEPSRALFLMLGLLGLMIRRRRSAR